MCTAIIGSLYLKCIYKMFTRLSVVKVYIYVLGLKRRTVCRNNVCCWELSQSTNCCISQWVISNEKHISSDGDCSVLSHLLYTRTQDSWVNFEWIDVFMSWTESLLLASCCTQYNTSTFNPLVQLLLGKFHKTT